jgi:glycosyltransferase involved in cell wall biosynthesis
VAMNSRPRVLLVSEAFPPDSGGVAISAQRIALNLSRLGHEVQLYTTDHSRPLDAPPYKIASRENNYVVMRVGPFFTKHPEASTLSEKHRAILRRNAFDSLLASAATFQPDVILSLYLLNAGYLAQLLGNALSKPVIAGVRGNDVGLNVFHVDRFAVIRWVLASATKIVCVNEHLRTRACLIDPDLAGKMLVIQNGVEIGRNAELPVAQQISSWRRNRNLVVAFVGTLREKKGIQPLLEALDDPLAQNICLLIIGPELDALGEKLAGHHVKRLTERGSIYFTGQIPHDEVGSWLIGCDAAVMPSLDDGTANGLLESMAAGLPVVCTTIFQDVTGTEAVLLVNPGDSSDLRKALLRLADDSKLRHTLGDRAKELMRETRNPEAEALAYSNLFARVISERND